MLYPIRFFFKCYVNQPHAILHMLELTFFCNLQSDKLTSSDQTARGLSESLNITTGPHASKTTRAICAEPIRNFWVGYHPPQ